MIFNQPCLKHGPNFFENYFITKIVLYRMFDCKNKYFNVDIEETLCYFLINS